MESYLIYIGKSAIAVGAFYLAFLLLFQNRKHFVFNRIYLPVSMALSFIIPLITFTTVRYIEQPSTAVAESFSFLPASPVEMIYKAPKFTLEWYHYLFGAYILGSAGFLCYLLLGHIKALHIIKKSRIQELFHNLVNITKKDVHPFSFFNKIVLSEKTLSHPNLEIIVNHEKIHVKEKHTLDILFTELLFLLQWFNPFAWLIKDAVKNNLEYKTDDQITKTTNAQTYQLAMVALADKKGVAPFLTALNGSQLKNRIIMMKKKTQNKYTWLKQLIILPLLAVLVMGLANKEVKTEIGQQDNKDKIQNSGILNRTIADVFPNNNITIPYRMENINEKNLDISDLKIIMDGKEISKDSHELRTIDLTQNSNSQLTIGKVIKALIPDIGKFEICKLDPEQNNKVFYIRTSDYVQGANQEFESKTTLFISLDGSGLNAQYYAINNELVSKNEFEKKGKEGFRTLIYLPIDLAKDKYGEKINGRVLDAKTGGANYFITNSRKISKNYTSKITVVVDGKEIPADSPELKNIKTTPEKYSHLKLVKEIKEALNIGKNDIISSLSVRNDIENPIMYIRTKNYVPGTNKEFDEKTDPAAMDPLKKRSFGKKIRPLIVIDGVPQFRISQNIDINSINTKNISDLINTPLGEVKSVEFQKTSDPTAYYGPQGEDGVLFITTKSGYEQNNKQKNITKDSVIIRGLSLIGNNRPLVVVDGVPQFRVSQNVDLSSANTKDIGKLINVPLENIKSIDIIKDAASTAVYGPQGADGVLLITTKSGSKQDEPVILESDSSEPVYVKVEDMPEFPGGELALRKYIANALRYPVIAQETGIEGKVYVSFIIDKYGEVTDAKIVQGVEESLNNEALRVVRILPHWKPGKQDGKAVNVSYTMPITFTLLDNSEERPLIVINGQPSGYKSLGGIDPESILTIKALKGIEAITKYGSAAKDGAIEINLKGWTNQNKITTQLELRKFVAEKIKYPLEAQQTGFQGTFKVAVTFSENGKVTAISEDTSNALLELGIVTVTSYKPDNENQAPEFDMDVMLNEIKRVINEFPIIDIDEFKGKTVLITVKFDLQ